ncbi:MAG: hypothetical protein HQL52_08165 [Magnetococcales bacterium]|nr:hypothetical protein [Magnetococcales bacterium]
MSTYEIFISLTQVMLLVLIVVQIFVAVQAVKANHERKRKQSTIEYLGKVWRESRLELESCYGTDPLTKDKIAELEADNKRKAEIVNLLGSLEHIAAGVNCGVYDKDILYIMSATSISSIYYRFKVFIDHQRVTANSSAYIQLEKLSNDFLDRKRGSMESYPVRDSVV